jgi:hypothetical protein
MKSNRSTIAFLMLGCAFTGAAFAQPPAAPAAPPVSAPSADFSPTRFRSHVAFLADDLLEGRETGSRGYDLAARYVAAGFEGLGLRPAGPEGSWYQQVPFVRFAATEPPRIAIGGRSFVHGTDLSFRQHPEAGQVQFTAPAVFAGYGIDAPSLGLDDYRGLDVRGRIVVAFDGTPAGLRSDVAAHLNGEKRRAAARRGAVGLILVRRQANDRTPPRGRPSEPGMTWVDPAGAPYTDAPGLRFVATANETFASALFEDARRPLATLRAAAARPGRVAGFALPQPLTVERDSANTQTSSPNVVAILPGTDPALANEYVLLMAHLDGLGVRESGPEGEDRIRNGAMDNATGVATLLEVARQMSLPGNRPRRPILFAAVTAEEKGLLGAQYLARNPVVDRVVGVVNLDMPVLTYDFSDVIAFGAEHSTLGPLVAQAAAGMNVALTPDPLPEQGLFTRSDHYMFVREGIPAVFLMTGFAGEGERRFRSFLAEQYHSPRDDMALPFNWQAGARFAELNYRIARAIADADQAPRWNSDSFFAPR